METDDCGEPSLDKLPIEIKKHILRYVSDPRSFLALERTCRSLRNVLASDQVWRTCPQALRGPGNSHRDRALIAVVLNEIREHQGKTFPSPEDLDRNDDEKGRRSGATGTNYLADVLGADGFRYLVQSIFDELRVKKDEKFAFFIRGDSVALWSEIIQKYICTKLEKAVLLATHTSSKAQTSVYPQVTLRDLEILEEMQFLDGESRLASQCKLFARHHINELRLSCPRLVKQVPSLFKIVRLIAYRAGVVKMTDAAFDSIVADLLRIVIMILDHVWETTTPFLDANYQDRWLVSADETIDMYNSPPPLHLENPQVVDAELQRLIVTIVPRQIIDHAELLGQSRDNKVYGATWIASEGKTVEEEIAKAELQYRTAPVRPSWLVNTDDHIDADDDSASMFESSDSEDISVYDDEDTSDMDSD